MNDQRYSTAADRPAPTAAPAGPSVDVRRPVGRYEDGAEAELAAIMAGAADRSSSSEELRAAIHDWPTRYHLSPMRANLLRPLRLGPRILEVGAGTGVLTRWLAEQGHDVLAVEGSLARAEVAAARCAGLAGAHVACGGAAEVDPGADGPFDAVLLVGVIEYAGVGGLPTADELLASCARALGPGGVVVVAIENQLGLQYLAGAPEDHRGVPAVGVEGYPTPGARTYHRRGLGELLAGHGLGQQRWLFPYPDYKLPAAILAEGAYDRLPPAQVDAFARHVASTHHGRFAHLWDLHRAHTTLVGAGLGPEVANSFLVVAGRAPADVDAVVDPTPLAWLYGDDRRPRWGRHRQLAVDGTGAVVVLDPGAGVARQGGVGAGGDGDPSGAPGEVGVTGADLWLAQRRQPQVAVVAGPDARQLALDACVRADGEALGAVLARWLAAVDEAAVAGGAADLGMAHPFRRAGARVLLSPDHLDVDLGNFVAGPGGELAYVDDEWVASGPVERDLVCVRALWNLARALVERGTCWPGGPTTTVDELTLELAARAGLGVGPADLADWRAAERHLQEAVVGGSPAAIEAWLDGTRSVAHPDGPPPPPAPVAHEPEPGPSPPAAPSTVAGELRRLAGGVRRRGRALARRLRPR